MEYFDKATKRIATEFASVIKLYRIERDKNNPKGVVTAADLVEKNILNESSKVFFQSRTF